MRRSTLPILACLVAFALAIEGRRLMDPPRVAHAQSFGGTYFLGNGWNISSVSSGSNVFTTNLKLANAGDAIRIDVQLGSSVPFGVFETDGTHTASGYLNAGTALTAGCRYTFTIEGRNSNQVGAVTQSGAGGATVTNGSLLGTTPQSFNFFVGGSTTVQILRVTEVSGSVD